MALAVDYPPKDGIIQLNIVIFIHFVKGDRNAFEEVTDWSTKPCGRALRDARITVCIGVGSTAAIRESFRRSYGRGGNAKCCYGSNAEDFWDRRHFLGQFRNRKWSCPRRPGIHWNNDLVVNYDYLHSSDRSGGVFWTINGSGFGKTKGTVKIGGFTLPSNKVVWSDTAITVYPDGSMISSSSPYNWGPKSVQIQVITSNLKTTSWTDTIIPAIQTRVYGQCAWWVALRRIQLGLVPSTTAYGGYRPISTWIPQVGDQLEWTSGKITHSAIVESVSRSGNIYTIKISEYNLNCDNQYSTESPITFNILTHTFIKTFKLGTPSGWYR